MSSVSQTVVCEEVFDDISHPSVEEIIEYATKIGIDPDNEPQLLPLAAEGLMKALPPGWKPCFDEKRNSYYYYNNSTGKTQWEHPLDEIYRGIVVKKRAESQSLSLGEPTEDATYTRDDLPSYEESPHVLISAKLLDPLPLGARKKEIKLSPLKSKPKIGDIKGSLESPKNESFYPKLLKQKSEDRIGSGMPFRKLNIHKFNSFDDKKEDSRNEFRLSGGGAMFLKSNTKTDGNLTSPLPHTKDFLSPDTHTHPRGILRERSLENSRSMEFPKSDKSDKEDDDKKSVRFNLENNPDITFDFSDRSLSDEELKDIKNEANEIINISINAKPKSRFIVSPVKDLYDKYMEEEKVIEYEDDNKKKENNLKLIRPDPKDFIQPRLKLSESTENLSDSDDSILKSISKEEKKLENLRKISIESDISTPQEKEEDEGIAEIIASRNKTKIQRELRDKIEIEMEELRKNIWEEKNEELQKYKHQIQVSQKSELERILMAEKQKQEDMIKSELEKLHVEMESRTSATLNEEKLKYEDLLRNKKDEIEERFKREGENLERAMETAFAERRKQLDFINQEKLDQIERDLSESLDKRKDELIVSHNAILDQIKQKHLAILDELKKDFKAEESIIRKEHQNQLAELRRKTANDIEAESNKSKDSGDERMYEKIRCEKRLLEDKYRCLKEKYLRLKTEVKLTIEKRNRRREQSITTTGSETERSNSINKERSPMHSPSIRNSDKPPTPKHLRSSHNDAAHKAKPDHKVTRQLIIQDIDTSMSDHSYKNDDKYKNDDSSDSNTNPGRSRKKMFSRLKSSSTSRINSSTKTRKSQRSCSPVENLRRQLQKLEDLEDQFPQNAHSDTYHLRYPFSDDQKYEGSSELEFFRHRIHLERDSIKRAKESLRSQKNLFQQRQKDLKLKHGSMARHTFQQLCQEEKELTDMEVSLHRTRSLLGEKIIRLRHLEQSLQRASLADDPNKLEDATLSDLSSHSASSGISSTEFAAADGVAGRTLLRGDHFQESTEIMQSLENLNSEIREIWEVLNKQQTSNMTTVVSPIPLIYPDLGWPILAGTATLPAPPSIPTLADRLNNYRQHVALANAQSTVVTHATQGATTTLVERTRNLRHWLRQAGIDSTNDSNTPQATL